MQSNLIWQLPPRERLLNWRQFRQSLEELPIPENLQKCVDWWKLVPLDKRVIDPYFSQDWPSPWDLIYNGKFDENAIALGVFYTLHYLGLECEVQLIQDHDDDFLGLVVVVDKQWVVCRNWGEVNTIDILPTKTKLEIWTAEQLT